jgi:ParB family chromosome partitioning protein
MNPTAPIPQDNDRRTPGRVIDLARATLGRIDLDPASDLQANAVVQAEHIFTKLDDGLTKPWFGRVFLNPPGGKMPYLGSLNGLSRAAVWWAKLLYEVGAGRVEAAIFVAFNIEAMLNTQKFAPRPIQAYPFCVPRKRLAFPSSCGEKAGSPPAASAIVCVTHSGENQIVSAFRKNFAELGWVT